MHIILVVLAFLVSNPVLASEDGESVVKNFSHRFHAYTIEPNGKMSEEEKQKKIAAKIASSKTVILARVEKLCSKFENLSGWQVKTWEANDLGWISGEGDILATFTCQVKKTSDGVCPEYSCSLGCHVFGGRCCIDQFCSIY